MGEAEDWHAAATAELRSRLVAGGALDDSIARVDEHAETHWAYSVIYDRLHFCGCGMPEAALTLVADLLALAPWYESWERVPARIGGDEATQHLVMYLLDGAGLMEHGGLVGGSWLTEDGQRFLRAMQTLDREAVLEAGYSCSDCP